MPDHADEYWRKALDREIDAAAELIVGPDAREGLAAFFAKRDPIFTGAPPL